MRTRAIHNLPLPRCLIVTGLLASIAGCSAFMPAATPVPTATTTPVAAPAPAPPTPPPIEPIDVAILRAANDLFSKAVQGLGAGEAMRKRPLVIDPLVDGVSGAQSSGTRSVERRIMALAQSKYPQFELLPFYSSSIAKSPIVLIGTFTGVNKERQPIGPKEAFRICLALADLASGKIIAKGLAFAKPDGIDAMPTAFFRDSPAWTKDPAIDSYIKSCQGTKAGDSINPVYLERIAAATLISEAINAYDSNRYEEALGYYRSAAQTSAGNQLRVYNGVYLANWKLGRRDEAASAFGRLVDYGLANNQLAVKFLFRPGSTGFWADPQVSGPYAIWLRQIAHRAAQNNACMEIIGHTSRTGSELLNDRLSLQRAQAIKDRLQSAAPPLASRLKASGKGFRENMVGSGSDDASDALDRRVEFKVLDC